MSTRMHDHNHEVCTRLPCPRCGIDPITGNYTDYYSGKTWSCDLCEACDLAILPELQPHERPLHLIEEAFP